MDKAKPYEISKKEVWQAYQSVKANRGAAGVDRQSIEEFEKDLKGNLYKIWNRMSSGAYFPPPVRLVEIPKGDGRMRRWASRRLRIELRRLWPRGTWCRSWSPSSGAPDPCA